MSEISEQELGKIYAFALQLGKEAGNMLMAAARSTFSGEAQERQTYTEKDSAVDIVTKTDEGELLNEQPASLKIGATDLTVLSQTWKHLSSRQ